MEYKLVSQVESTTKLVSVPLAPTVVAVGAVLHRVRPTVVRMSTRLPMEWLASPSPVSAHLFDPSAHQLAVPSDHQVSAPVMPGVQAERSAVLTPVCNITHVNHLREDSLEDRALMNIH